MKPSKWLMQQSKHARLAIFLSVVIAYLASFLIIVQAGLIAYIVNAVFIQHRSVRQLLAFFIAFIVVIVLRSLFGALREYVAFRSGAKVRSIIRKALWVKMCQLGPVQLKAQGDAAALSHHLIEEVESFQNFYAQYLPQMLIAVLVPITILCIVFPLSWISGVILLITAPLIPLFMALVGMGAASLNRKNFVALARMSRHFLDILQGMSTLHLFDASQRACRQVEQVSEDYRRTTMKVLKVAFLSSGVLELFASVSIALLATYLGLSFLGYIHFGYAGHHLSLTVGLFILLLAPEFYLPLRELGTHYHARAEAVGAAEEILTVLNIPMPEPVTTEKASVRSDIKKEAPIIILRDIDYCYPNRENNALTKIHLDIMPGERVAIVGPSGAGKTTLLNLLAGFVCPSSGVLRMNQICLNSADQLVWRRNFTWLGQNPRLFHGSVADNLRVACPDASDAQLYDALEKAYMRVCVEALPAKLETVIGEGQSGLSGGQLQRVALARAYLKSAPILLLDEPTAHLDHDSEESVMRSLQTLTKDKTLVMLTHRFQYLPLMDKIIVLDGGQIVQQGTFVDLSQQSGLFQTLGASENV